MTFSLSPSTSQSDSKTIKIMNIPESASDFNQWLHAMKMVARLPGGMPPEFRRKLWLALSDRFIIQSRKIDWNKEEIKCLSDEYKADDEELGIQIVKDLHRTGSSLCSGPNGTINQAKLKRVLLGYARFNPEVGYCQGFNMLGALILQVMDKIEADSIKVMIYLIEGIIPPGYFCGSLGGLQVDMSVFRELLTIRLPKLAHHLQRLQGPSEEEPPLINMFNMQWFLTVFCTCLPINCVLRIWDLILIEGSDVLLRTALSIWGLLEKKIITTRTADDFYCTMGELSAQLLSGTLIDSNGLVQKVVELGRIPDLQKLRDKHLYNITPMRDKKGIKLFYSDDECESDDESQLAVATAYGMQANKPRPSLKNLVENKDRIALDITLLKKQYDKLRERHRQAHVILTAACSKPNTQSSSSLQMNQLLMGKSAIVSNKGRRIGPPKGAVPPRIGKPVKSTKNVKPPKLKPAEPISRDAEEEQRRRNSIKWKDIKEERRSSMVDQKLIKRNETLIKRSSSQSSGLNLDAIAEQSSSKRKSESSSYSDETESNSSSTSTSLCDDDIPGGLSSLENSPRKKNSDTIKSPMTELEKYESIRKYVENLQFDYEKGITFGDCESVSNDSKSTEPNVNVMITIPDAATDTANDIVPSENIIPSNIVKSFPSSSCLQFDNESIVSTSQLSPIPDISHYISLSTISPLMTPSTCSMNRSIVSSNQMEMFSSSSSTEIKKNTFLVSDEGVTNEFFERINIKERPNHLDLSSFTSDMYAQNDYISNKQLDDGSPQISCTVICSPKTEPPPIYTENPVAPTSGDEETIHMSATGELTAAYELTDRTRYLREKSFSMDTPNLHPMEDLTTRSSSDSKVSNNIENSKRISRIIEENTIMLDRMKKAFTANESDDRCDISIEDIIHVSDTLTNIISNLESHTLETVEAAIGREDEYLDHESNKCTVTESSATDLNDLMDQSIEQAHSGESTQITKRTPIDDTSKTFEILDNSYKFESDNTDLDCLNLSPKKQFGLLTPTTDSHLTASETSKVSLGYEQENYSAQPSTDTLRITKLEYLGKEEEMKAEDTNREVYSRNEHVKDILREKSISETETPELRSEVLVSIEKLTEFETTHGENSEYVPDTLLTETNQKAEKKKICFLSKSTKFSSTFDHGDNEKPLEEVESKPTTSEIASNSQTLIDLYMPPAISHPTSTCTVLDKSWRKAEEPITEKIVKPMSLSTEFELELKRKSIEIKPDKFVLSKTDELQQTLTKELKKMLSESSVQTPTKTNALSLPLDIKAYGGDTTADEYPKTVDSRNIKEKQSPISGDVDSQKDNLSAETSSAYRIDDKNAACAEKADEYFSRSHFRTFKQSTTPEKDEIILSKFECSPRSTTSDDVSSYKKCSTTTSKTSSPSSNYSRSPKNTLQYSDEQPSNDITATINSIESTIKSINMLCKRNDDEKIFARLDKIINEKPRFPNEEIRTIKSAPKIMIDNKLTSEEDFNYSSYRTSRNNQRCVSPRRRKDENKEEYVSRVRRGDVSPAFGADESRSASTNRYSFPDPICHDGTRYSDSYDSRGTSVAPPTGSPFPDKFEIRHTTFTSTFYDRFLSHKKEQSARTDKSPSSPTTITRSYLESLRATPTVTTANRVISKSAENSPSRKKSSSVTFSLTTSEAYSSSDTNKLSSYNYSHIKSCDNIPTNLRAKVDEIPSNDKQFNYKYDTRTKPWN